MGKINKPGFWKKINFDPEVDDYEILDVYEGETGILCIWGPEVGITYTGAADTQSCWENDDLQGHVPISWFTSEDEEFVLLEDYVGEGCR